MTDITMQRAMYILGHAYGLNGTKGISAYFEGNPGGGKTTMVRSFARKYLDNNCFSLELSRSQGTDLNIPIPDHNRKRVDFYTAGPISDLADKKKGLLFFDELTRASDQGTLAAALNIFLDHRLGNLDFRHVHVWACANPAGMVGGIELDVAFANRIVMVRWPETMDVEDYAAHMSNLDAVEGIRDGNEWPAAPVGWEERWADNWAKANQLICSFLRVSSHLLTEPVPNTFRPWRSPRSWHTATNVLAACLLHGATTSETRALMAGTIGDEAAHSFLAWQVNADLPDPRKVLSGETKLGKLPADKMFLALSVACDTLLADRSKGRNENIKPFVDTLLECADIHMEVVAPIAGRMARGRIVEQATSKLYTKVLPTK